MQQPDPEGRNYGNQSIPTNFVPLMRVNPVYPMSLWVPLMQPTPPATPSYPPSSHNVQQPAPARPGNRFGQNIQLNVEHDPICVDFIVTNTNFRMRITSNYKRGIYFTALIRLYIRCDTRVLPLLRLFRFFVKGPPRVCTVCAKTDHEKPACPKLSLPSIITLQDISKHWFDVLSRLCRKITGMITRQIVKVGLLYQLRLFVDESQMANEDVEQREKILTCLEKEFQKLYPGCRVHSTGSFKNGFGFQHSDLDVCIELEMNNNESSIQILENLAQCLQSNEPLFRIIEIVRNARVPIVRLVHIESDIEVDISVNNLLPIENTRLLKMYSDIDPRVRELGFVVKTLAKV
ncbi:unnamed protein product [Rotaria sp. Silwood1]|nr:unnamed protein product [Rotaria sp. Silwood1]